VSPNLIESELNNLRAISKKGKNKNERRNYRFKDIKVLTNNEKKMIQTIYEFFNLNNKMNMLNRKELLL